MGTPSTWVDGMSRQLNRQLTTLRVPTVFDNLPILPAVQSLQAARLTAAMPQIQINGLCPLPLPSPLPQAGEGDKVSLRELTLSYAAKLACSTRMPTPIVLDTETFFR